MVRQHALNVFVVGSSPAPVANQRPGALPGESVMSVTGEARPW